MTLTPRISFLGPHQRLLVSTSTLNSSAFHNIDMSGWIQMFGKRDARQTTREAMVSLRQQLVVLEKKEEHLEQRIEEEHTKAKMLVAAKKTG